MRLPRFILVYFCFALMQRVAAQSPPLIVDGEWQDWTAIQAALIDPADAPDATVDFGEVRIAHTRSHVHLLIDFGRTVNAQGLDGTALILLDADGDPTSGKREHGLDGVDVIVNLSPRNAAHPDRPGMGMGVRSTTYFPDPADPNRHALSVYDIGLHFAPTHASRRIEFRIDRNAKLPETPALFQGDHVTLKFVFIDVAGAIADETGPITHDLRTGELPLPGRDDTIDPLARTAGADLRIMNWNVWRGTNFTNPDPFARTIVALQPDVILLQELPENSNQDEVKGFLARATQSDEWNVVFGAGGGDLRCAIAARLPMHKVLQSIPMPDQPNRTLRAVGAIIELGEQRLLAVAVHLRCCGRAGGPEDQQRLIEVRTLSEAMIALMKEQRIDGVIIAGDFNLVGSRDPAEVMAAGLDLDRTALRISHPLGLDGLAHVTWRDRQQPFAPGRLDLLLHSDSRLEVSRSFVYDSRSLSSRWLTHYAVLASDSSEASDHLPIVADMRWIGNAASDANQ